MKPIPFDYYAPTNTGQALDTLAELGYSGKVLAGGQSLVASMNFRLARPAALVDLNNVPELFYIKPTSDGGVNIGTMTRVASVHNDAEVMKRFPLLAEVIPNIAHQQIRNRGTFGGAIAHADPAGQLPAISVVLNASLLVKGKGKERRVNAGEFFTGPFMTVLEPEEMLVEVTLPPMPANSGASYQQVSRQRGGYAQAAVATVLVLDSKKHCQDVRMVLMSVSDIPFQSSKAREILVGQELKPEAFKEVADAVTNTEIDPATDIHATADYRRQLTRVLVERSLNNAFERARKGG